VKQRDASYTSRTADKFVVRLPEGMRDQIADVARNHHRSMNSEIIARLKASLDGVGPQPKSVPHDPQHPWTPMVGMPVYHGDELYVIQRLRVVGGDHLQVILDGSQWIDADELTPYHQ